MGPWRHLGILEPVDYDGDVTGTVVMLQREPREHGHSQGESEQGTSVDPHEDALKRTKNGIVLHPQPRNNPNDPLNWPVWRRDLALGVIGFHCFIIGGQTAILASAFTKMSKDFGVTQSKLAYLVGAYMLMLGVGSVCLAPFAVKFGKRPVYLVALVIFIGGSLWGGASTSYNSLLGARIIMGFGGSPTESLPSSSIAEIYFLHERAYRLGIYTLLMLGGKNLLPMISAFIISNIGYHWLFWIEAMVVGVNLLLTFLFVPETFFDRTPTPNMRSLKETEMARLARDDSISSDSPGGDSSTTDQTIDQDSGIERGVQDEHANNAALSSTAIEELATVEPHEHAAEKAARKRNRHPKFDGIEDDEDDNDQGTRTPRMVRPGMGSRGISVQSQDVRYLRRTVSMDSALIEPKPYVKTLSVINGVHSPDKLWMIALRPFVLYCYPPVLFSIVTYAMSVVWLITISEVVSEIFSKPPYDFPATSVGLLYIAMFVGGCFGSAIAGRFSDIIVRVLSRRNGGVYEPEFRLVMMVPVMFAVSIGLMGFGWSSWDKDLWIVPAIFLGILGFGCSLGSTTAITYAVDSYKVFAAEALVSLNFCKNVIGFCFSLFVPKFNLGSGTKWTYVTFGIIQIFLCLWGIPLYIYGKRLRHWTDKAQLMKRLYVKRD